MNRFSHGFAKHEGSTAKHLLPYGEKAMRINEADVAELVDARDLKSPAATDLPSNSCKTSRSEPIETAAAPPHLQKRNGGER